MIPENSADQVWVTSPGCLPLGLGLGSFFSTAKIWSHSTSHLPSSLCSGHCMSSLGLDSLG